MNTETPHNAGDGQPNDTLTAVEGIRVGHFSDPEACTGCSVVILPHGARAAVVLRGRAHGTRELTPLEPGTLVESVDAIVLTGGSAFGLAAADGVTRRLEEHGRGFPTPFARVPIVPAAVLYDLGIGRADVRPGPDQGRMACDAASGEPVEVGSVGAGTGATIGKIAGMDLAMKGGLGCAALRLATGVTVGALAVVNALGDVLDPETGEIVAGARRGEDGRFANTVRMLLSGVELPPIGGTNTTLAVVATDAALDHAALKLVADQAQDGLGRCIQPTHTLVDGDAVFAVSAGRHAADVNVIGVAASQVIVQAVLAAVTSAQSLHGVPSIQELRPR